MNIEDSIELIKEDAIKLTNKYWNCEYACNYCSSRIEELKPYKYYGTMDCTEAMKLDLIERTVKVMENRAERTCKGHRCEETDEWVCHECGGSLAGCMFDPVRDGFVCVPNFCPNCGAKVVYDER